ncbi:MAG: tyrosine-type recombinase/integrase [Jatrophihabitans sp.]|uniref:tyrosine-type recombinase/integrase n=1 Tax=Jatrophihabitans sp. TaxID=1932789 RepID=UPI00390F6A61
MLRVPRYRFSAQPDGTFVTGAGGRKLRCDRGKWSWVTSHTFRKTVATRLDECGFTPRQVADQLGHTNPSMTLDVYFGRQVVSAAAAAVLDRRNP